MDMFEPDPMEEQALLQALGGAQAPPDAGTQAATKATGLTVGLPEWKERLGSAVTGGVDVLLGALGVGEETQSNLLGQLLNAGMPIVGGLKALKVPKVPKMPPGPRSHVELPSWTPAVPEDVGLLARQTKNALAEQKLLPHLDRAPVEHFGPNMLVSDRVPTAVKSTASSSPLMVGLDEVMQGGTRNGKPPISNTLAEHMRDLPLISGAQAAKSDASVLNRSVDVMQSNYEFLLKEMQRLGYADRSKQWYDGAHKVAMSMAKMFGVEPNQASGVLAALSPQKDWHQNAEMAKRVISNFQNFERAPHTKFEKEHATHFIEKQLVAMEDGLKKKVKDGKLTPASVPAARAVAAEEIALRARTMEGKAWGQMNPREKAIMMRAYDEVANGQLYPILSPEGGVARKVALTGEGEPAKMGWQSYRDIEKAISMLENGSPENISRMLGGEHKVRAFFDNISVPNYGRGPGGALDKAIRAPTTSDTHHVAAGNLRPMGSKSPVVKFSMGGTSDSLLGLSGSNPLYQEASSRASALRGLLPREGQSIEWEGLKGLFSPAQKRDEEKLVAAINRLWEQHRKGRMSLANVQDAILNTAGGIDAPSWLVK